MIAALDSLSRGMGWTRTMWLLEQKCGADGAVEVMAEVKAELAATSALSKDELKGLRRAMIQAVHSAALANGKYTEALQAIDRMG